ncbi:UDP-N-acetylglucosamine 2-epimerase (non-hydrolyzing) [bacterium]|nr:UDP-N-acetylglucosamine 2-epimerase (non-hydrolyzing) [candidate division CSSED10-310 bacterium]
MKIAMVVGNRPHFVKAAPLLRIMSTNPDIQTIIIHTGQHYDHSMSGAFLEGFSFPPVDVNLGVGSGSIGMQTGTILAKLDPVYRKLAPDCILSMGDTNTTLAAALAAYQQHIPNAHIEAGMRENIWRPEEINKIVADHCADYLFAPIPRAVENLRNEGFPESRIFYTGDITLDTFVSNRSAAMQNFHDVRKRFPLIPEKYDLMTLHRAETVDDPVVFGRILDALTLWPIPIVFPVHPRTEKQIRRFGFDARLTAMKHVLCLPALPYLDFLGLLLHADRIATDSSGVLKEAFYAGKLSIVLDDSTEYCEIFDMKAAFMGGRDTAGIASALNKMKHAAFPTFHDNPFGGGQAAQKMISIILGALMKTH